MTLPREASVLAELIRRRQLSAVELTQASLDAIRARDPDIGAFVEIAAPRALREAARADQLAQRGDAPLPALLGVPTGIKDHEALRGHFTRVGSRALRWLWSPVDGAVARACRSAGAVMLGKLATSELTILPFIDTALGPPTRNPYARDRYAGGSSGGSAAAVAAGLIPIAPGSDGAGSIRIPASFCGLVGFKTGRGVVPNPYAGIDPVGISAVGPLAHSVRDAALLIDVLTGRPFATQRPVPGSFAAAALAPAPRGLRIRLVRTSPLVEVDPEIDAAAVRVARIVEGLGHVVEEAGPLDGEVDEFIPIMARLVAAVPFVPGTVRLLEPTTRWLRDRGRATTRAASRRAGDHLGARVRAWFGDTDVMITPTVGLAPPHVGSFAGKTGEEVFRAAAPLGAFTAPFNVSGQPAVSLPAGRTRAGLPIGVQLVAPRGADRALIGIAAAVEAALAS